MLIDLAFEYTAEVRLRGRRRDSREIENRTASVPVDIPECSSEAAPVVVEWRGGGRDDNRGRFPLRVVGGRLYRRVALETGRGGKELDFLRATAANPSRRWAVSRVTNRIGENRRNIPLEGDLTVGDVLASNREAHERALRAWACDNVIVDGALYEPCGEPRLFFRLDPRTRRMGVTFDQPKWRFQIVDGKDVVAFRLDEVEKATTLAEACGLVGLSVPDLRFVAPELLKLAVERENLAVAALEIEHALRHARYALKVRDGGRRLTELGLAWPHEPPASSEDLDFLAMRLNAMLTGVETTEATLDAACETVASKIQSTLDTFDGFIAAEPRSPWALPLGRDAVQRWRDFASTKAAGERQSFVDEAEGIADAFRP
jgi:hypothetical protein